MAERIQGFALLNIFIKIVFQKNASKKLGAFFKSFFVILGYDPVSLSECMGNEEWGMGVLGFLQHSRCAAGDG